MKVAELKEELEARDELKTGNKAWLRRRLHGAIVRVHLEAAGADGPRDCDSFLGLFMMCFHFRDLMCFGRFHLTF